MYQSPGNYTRYPTTSSSTGQELSLVRCESCRLEHHRDAVRRCPELLRIARARVSPVSEQAVGDELAHPVRPRQGDPVIPQVRFANEIFLSGQSLAMDFAVRMAPAIFRHQRLLYPNLHGIVKVLQGDAELELLQR